MTTPQTVMDPVCNMEVDPATAQWSSQYKGKTYYFCAPGCKREFDQDPEQYLSQQDIQEAQDAENTQANL